MFGKLFGFLIAATLLGSAANASVIYSNAPPAAGGTGNEATEWLQTQEFTVAGSTTVTGGDVYIAGFGSLANWEGLVQYFFFTDNSGTPGTQIATGTATINSTTDTGIAWCCSGDAFDVNVTFGSGVTLSSTGDYFFGIHLATDYNNRDDVYWVQSSINDGFTGVESNFGTQDNWFNNGIEHAYTLVNTPAQVPEPASLPLLGAALIGMAAVRRRARS